MDLTLPARLLTLAVATAFGDPAPDQGQAEWRALDAETAAALEALADERLEEQRAGAFEQIAPLDEVEIAALEAAQDSAPELEAQRGGDIHLTDREVQIVLWTAAVILVVVLLG